MDRDWIPKGGENGEKFSHTYWHKSHRSPGLLSPIVCSSCAILSILHLNASTRFPSFHRSPTHNSRTHLPEPSPWVLNYIWRTGDRSSLLNTLQRALPTLYKCVYIFSLRACDLSSSSPFPRVLSHCCVYKIQRKDGLFLITRKGTASGAMFALTQKPFEILVRSANVLQRDAITTSIMAQRELPRAWKEISLKLRHFKWVIPEG